MSQQPIDTNCMTLTRFVLSEQRRFGGQGDLSQLLTSIQSAIKAISAAVRRAGISKLFGAAGDTNVQGEEVCIYHICIICHLCESKTLIVHCHKIFNFMYF